MDVYIYMDIYIIYIYGILFLDWNLGIVVFGKTKQNVEIYQEQIWKVRKTKWISPRDKLGLFARII